MIKNHIFGQKKNYMLDQKRHFFMSKMTILCENDQADIFLGANWLILSTNPKTDHFSSKMTIFGPILVFSE